MVTDFSKGNVSTNIIRQAIPLTLAQLVQLLYSVADRIYIGHLSDTNNMALTGIGLTFPIITLVAAFTNLFGTGGTPLFSIASIYAAAWFFCFDFRVLLFISQAGLISFRSK